MLRAITRPFAASPAQLPVTALARPVPFPVRRFVLFVLIAVALGAVGMIMRELITFEHQARVLAALASDITFEVEPGPSPTVRFPVTGESDRRLGYTHVPDAVTRLEAEGFEVAAQARWSPRLQWVVDRGLNAPYRRRPDAGLVVLDRHGAELHRTPNRVRLYRDFTAIPPLVVDTLLFIENRELLDDRHRYRNPAVEWDRLAHSLTLKVAGMLGSDRKTPGASTLATQLEKYHHSPGGRTDSAGEKLRQMVSASLRSYLDGRDTVATRQRIVTEYLDTVPLAAAPGFGEVHGVGNGLFAWFGADFQAVNRLLAAPEGNAAALAYRQLLTLLIAERRPSYYLLQDRDALADLTDAYLRLLGREGVIRGSLLEDALGARVDWQREPPPPTPLVQRKWPYFVRARLIELLGVPSLYDLDRWDLTVNTTLDGEVQARVTELLRALGDPGQMERFGLDEHSLLGGSDPAQVIYSVTLTEHVDGANRVRIQADNADRPLDINRGVKLDLGSTAKLRTLVTYLDLIARLHDRYAGMSREQRFAERRIREDVLARWVLERLDAEPSPDLRALLDAAMQRRYSASPRRAFFTGGGRHVFANFDADDDGRVLTVSEAFERSVNLVFVRMMADVIATYQADRSVPGDSRADGRGRADYLARFADREGTDFLRRFHREYAGLAPDQVLARVLEKARPSAASLATALAAVDAGATAEDLHARLEARGVEPPDQPGALEDLLLRHGPHYLSLPDQGHVTRLHPLELWLAGRLFENPAAAVAELIADSSAVRQQVYGWLFKTSNRRAQDRRIETLREHEAFLEMHALWQRLGFPFASLVPSLATALGSSADNPGALTELVGILANDGIRYPTMYMTGLAFGAGTPYETQVRRLPASPQRVLAAEVAAVAREALTSVVERGTARRLNRLAPTFAARVGGKTGTGDHRYERYGSNGQVLESRVVNRSAVFTFVIGERFFGTVTAFVPGAEAAGYRFTSALPVQVLGHLLPSFEPLLNAPAAGAVDSGCDDGACAGRRVVAAGNATAAGAVDSS